MASVIIGSSFSIITGTNVLMWTQEGNQAKLAELEIIGAAPGDNCDIYVLDTIDGTYSGIANQILYKIAASINIGANFYRRSFDVDVKQNIQIKIVYESVSDKSLYINFNTVEAQ